MIKAVDNIDKLNVTTNSKKKRTILLVKINRKIIKILMIMNFKKYLKMS